MLGSIPSAAWKHAWPNWSASSPAASPEPSLPLDPALLAGIAAYRRHPFQRDLPEPPALWEEGGSTLRDYAPGSDAPPILVVPSLINRADILDLMPEHSMLRFLASQGLRPILLDWGWPGDAERRFTLTDYIAGRLERALLSLGRPAALVGYCMGGLMALAAALRQPARVTRLALLATPWDFHAEPSPAPRLAPHIARFAQGGTLPIDVLQTLFSLIDPAQVPAKFRAFGRAPQDGPAARRFVALEDWLADGVPLAEPVARECLEGWTAANTPARGEWRIAGSPVDPRALVCPALVAIPARDRIVPPASAEALATLLPQATLLRPGAGHVGMVAGSRARTVLWEPLAAFLQEDRPRLPPPAQADAPSAPRSRQPRPRAAARAPETSGTA